MEVDDEDGDVVQAAALEGLPGEHLAPVPRVSLHPGRVQLINKVLIESKQMQVGEKICQLYYLHWSDLPASAATASSLV